MDDIIGSPYAVTNYSCNPQLGSDDGHIYTPNTHSLILHNRYTCSTKEVKRIRHQINARLCSKSLRSSFCAFYSCLHCIICILWHYITLHLHYITLHYITLHLLFVQLWIVHLHPQTSVSTFVHLKEHNHRKQFIKNTMLKLFTSNSVVTILLNIFQMA